MLTVPLIDPGLSASERAKLVGILRRLGSDYGGERAAAALLADRMLRAKGLGWDEVIAAGRAVRPSRLVHEAGVDDLRFCARHAGELDEWEVGFIASLGRQRGPLTAKQKVKVAEIATKLRARGLK